MKYLQRKLYILLFDVRRKEPFPSQHVSMPQQLTNFSVVHISDGLK